MTTVPGTVACPFTRPRRRASRPHRQSEGLAPPPPVSAGRVPRVARLLALAIRLEQLVQARVIANYAALAELGHVSRARVTQILNLLLLAPDIQEALLFLPRTERGRDAIHLGDLQRLTLVVDWKQQRKLWQALLAKKGLGRDSRRVRETAAGERPTC
jgi:hypothetical protein